MIVYAGDWIKVKNQWRQVVDLRPDLECFAVLNEDGDNEWWSTEVPEVFKGHLSNKQMQAKLEEAGL